MTGEEGFDFLGMRLRKTKAETSKGKVYYTTQQWLTRKAEERIREVVKERLALPNMRHKSFIDHVEWLNPKIQGWRNYDLQPTEDGEAGLVHRTTTFEMVCEEATTLALDKFDPRGQVLSYTWT
ncbi:hypothetical protein [Paenibacillus thiaminolyticus]|uniref:hypothetical protein n=1 Tax=Paenibacillus thiaminolyticus TaxID=49283 RepID=UPI0025427E37|nr:hypothetical protein [Paenibacillus thiaminolyticus]WII37223.1 hypothetical protein O0V01_27170 [Paenibacillus thiaminolyticus]